MEEVSQDHLKNNLHQSETVHIWWNRHLGLGEIQLWWSV